MGKLIRYTQEITPFFILIKLACTNVYFRRYYDTEFLRDKAYLQLQTIKSAYIPISKSD